MIQYTHSIVGAMVQIWVAKFWGGSTSSIFVEMNIASAPTNAHTLYCIGMLDRVVIHDVRSGDIQVRI